ncbi:unnamed protein product [Auanema sp. JU1783]|nr:unnamed protein product [Auanema sp. JU1783]
MFNIQYPPIYQEKNVARKNNSVLNAEFGCVNLEYSVQPKDKSMKILIYNIKTEGIHKFGMKNFDSRDEKDDLVLDVNGVKLHCHSQILSQNSEIFKTMIKENEGSSEICLKDSIPLEDLQELLHYLYLPCEPVDDHNFRQLLHWGHKFETYNRCNTVRNLPSVLEILHETLEEVLCCQNYSL